MKRRSDKTMWTAVATGCAIVLSVLPLSAARAADLVVNSADDSVDTSCDPAHCSLREAILVANLNEGPDRISFRIGEGVQTIQPFSSLPALEDTTTIDATTQPGYAGMPLIVIVGPPRENPLVNSPNVGLSLRGDDSTLKGVAVDGFYIGIYARGDRISIEGNHIGVTPDGASMTPADGVGIIVSGADVTVGGPEPSDRNVIGGWSYYGISLEGTNGVVQGNYIGTDASGMKAVPNGSNGSTAASGVFINADGQTVGGDQPGEGNLISGNARSGISGGTVAVINRARVQGNVIGLTSDGRAALPNAHTGIWLHGSGHVVGGDGPAGNVVAASPTGIRIAAGQGDGTRSVVTGNLVGTDVTGERPIPNGVGVVISSIGVEVLRNVISGNSGDGIKVQGWEGGSGTTAIKGNRVGVSVTGAPLGNGGSGVAAAAWSATIGGEGVDDGNVIAHNAADGVRVAHHVPGTWRVTIVGNEIRDNDGLGIDSGSTGVTANDADDSDVEEGGAANHPVLDEVVADGAELLISGNITGAPDHATRLHFYASSDCDDSGSGEGALYLGAHFTATDASGRAAFAVTLPQRGAHRVVTATATRADGVTSEFSPCEVTQSAPSVSLDASATKGVLDLAASAFDADGIADLVAADVGVTNDQGKIVGTWTLDDFVIQGDTVELGVVGYRLTGAAPWTVTFTATDRTGHQTTTSEIIAR